MTSAEKIKLMRSVGPQDDAFHAQLYPFIYPIDHEAHQLVKSGVSSIEIFGDNIAIWREVHQRGGQLKRLRVLSDPNMEPNIEVARIEAEIFEPLQDLGERTRFAWFGQQITRLHVACPDSPIVAQYLKGVESGDPWNSFWTFRGPVVDGASIAVFMHYEQKKPQPSQVHTAPFAAEEKKYIDFWRSVYDNPTQSMDLEQTFAEIRRRWGE